MGQYVAQPSAFQTNAFQAPGVSTPIAVYGDSYAHGYADPLYFAYYHPDSIIVPREFRELYVLDRVEVLYPTTASQNIVVEYEARLMYSPRIIT